MSSEPRDVFVSYNRADRTWAEWIAWTLEEAGYSVAVQAWDSRPGQNFGLFMDQAARARQTVAVLSPSYLEAEYTQPEWSAAFVQDPGGAERILIPVRVAECRPDGLLRGIVYADLLGLNEEAARRMLLDGFEERGKPPVALPFPGGGTRSIGAPRAKPPYPGPAVAVSTSKLPAADYRPRPPRPRPRPSRLGPDRSRRGPGLLPSFRPLDRAVDGLREAGTEDHLPRGLLARAALRRLSGDPDGAAADVREAQEIAWLESRLAEGS